MTARRRVLRVGRPQARRLAGAVGLGALAAGSAVALAAVSAWLIARASEQPPVLHLMVAIVAVRALGASRGILRYLERLVSHDTSFRILGDLRAATVQRLERILPEGDPERGGSLASGDLLARFVADVDGLMDLWARIVVPVAAAVVVGAAAAAVAALMVPAAGLLLAATMVAAAVVAPALSRRADRGAGSSLPPLRGRYRGDLVELLSGASELAVYGALPARLAALDELDAAAARAEARTAGAAGVGAAVAVAAGGAATVGAFALAAAAVARGELAPVDGAVLALLPLAAHEVVAGIAAAAHRLPALDAAAARVVDVLDRPPAVVEPDDPRPLPAGPRGVAIRGLVAGWSEARAPALRGVDLDLEPGVATVVVGPSGSGKSTLAAVLMRFLDPIGGSVRLVGDGGEVDVREVSSDDVRRVVGWCAQDPHLFDSTIEANLRLARPDATADELRDALRLAQLEEWVDSLPEGIDTRVGEHGRQVSGGQRQRMAIARVLLAGREVVVFDEPTEHLDDDAAAVLAAQILALRRDRAVLVLTHRPELFRGADRVLALHDGALVEEPGIRRGSERTIDPVQVALSGAP